MIYQSPYALREELKRRVQDMLRQVELKYEEVVRARAQLDHLRHQDIQLRQEFNSLQATTWRRVASANSCTASAMSILHLTELENSLQELGSLISLRTQAYNKLTQDAYGSVSQLLSTINDCIRCES